MKGAVRSRAMGRARLVARACAIALVVAASIPFSSCSRDEVPGTRFLIGVSQANLTEPWRVAMTSEIREEASRHRDLRLIYCDAADSSERQVNDVHRLLELGVDLLIISPTDSRVLTPVVREAYAKVPVIVLDRAVEGYDYTLFIGPDNERLGREAGELASDLLGLDGGTSLEIQGRLGSPPSMERSQGFNGVLAKKKGARLAEPIVADWLRDKAEDEMRERIGGLRKVSVVFAQNDAMALGAWRAAQAAGRKDMRFIGIDGLQGDNGGIELVRRGVLSATFTYPTGGKEAIMYGMDLLLKKEGIPKKIFLRPHKVTKESLVADSAAPRERRGVIEGRKILLGYAQVGSESEWRLVNTKSIKSAAERAGIDLLFEDGKQRQDVEIEAIRSFIRRKVDVIAFSPVVASGWEEVLKEARDAGIPVILTDRSVNLKNDSLWLSFMGSDFREEGRRAARWLVDNAPRMPQVRIAEIRGTEDSAPAIERKIGFEEVLRDNPRFAIVDSEMGDFVKEKGYAAMKRILAREGRSINAVFAHNDDMALGAIQAIREFGLVPGKDVTIVSIDATHGAFVAMLDGSLNCTVECNPLLGPLLMKAVTDYMDGKELPLSMIASEGVFPSSVARKELPGRQY
jgi:galactofuranose transport system substrate-binding protein